MFKKYSPEILFLIIAALFVVVGVFTACDDKKGRPLAPSESAWCLDRSLQPKIANWGQAPNFYLTPNGARIKSAVPVPDNALQTIDRAIEFSAVVQRAQFPEWQQGLTAPEWEIFFLDSDGIAPIAQTPVLLVQGIPSAGTITFCQRPAPNEINSLILPEFSALNWANDDALFWYVFNEGEHFRERRNSPSGVFPLFLGAADEHPHRHEGKPSPYDLLPKTLKSARIPVLPSCGISEN